MIEKWARQALGLVAPAAFVLLLLRPAAAGPPFRTDDPEPVDFQHYEFYTLSTGTHVRGDTFGVAPAFEYNYGFMRDAHIHVIVPAVTFDAAAGTPAHVGYGDTELGLKYRFVEEDENGWRPQVGTFPITLLPTGAESRGLGSGHPSQFLPIWVQKSFGEWTTYGGGGYWINQANGSDDRNYWFFGWLLQRKFTDKLTLGGEIFHQTAIKIGERDTTGFNFGGTYDLDEHNHLLFSAGRNFRDAAESNLFSWYVAYQITR